MNYDEAAFAELPRAGLSAGYVARETRRVLDAVQGRIAVYPGIDVGVPGRGKQVTPQERARVGAGRVRLPARRESFFRENILR